MKTIHLLCAPSIDIRDISDYLRNKSIRLFYFIFTRNSIARSHPWLILYYYGKKSDFSTIFCIMCSLLPGLRLIVHNKLLERCCKAGQRLQLGRDDDLCRPAVCRFLEGFKALERNDLIGRRGFVEHF